MAYKLLCSLLPVDIVEKIIEYNIFSEKLYRIHKAFNHYKIKKIASSSDKRISRINRIKNSAYSKLIILYDVYPVTHPSNTDIYVCRMFSRKTQYKINKYIVDNCKFCWECKQTNMGCQLCDHSMCKDEEIVRLIGMSG